MLVVHQTNFSCTQWHQKTFTTLYTSLDLVQHTQLSTRHHQNVKKQFLTCSYTTNTHLEPPSQFSYQCNLMYSHALTSAATCSVTPAPQTLPSLSSHKKSPLDTATIRNCHLQQSSTTNMDDSGRDQYTHTTCFQSCSMSCIYGTIRFQAVRVFLVLVFRILYYTMCV